MQNGGDPTDRKEDALAIARLMYAERRERERVFGQGLFGEPAWDLLLDIYIQQRLGKRVQVSSACIGAAVPSTTGLRWLSILQRKGLIRRFSDELDRRRSFVELEASAASALEALLLQASQPIRFLRQRDYLQVG